MLYVSILVELLRSRPALAVTTLDIHDVWGEDIVINNASNPMGR